MPSPEFADHICPWSAVYGTTQLLGGDVKFALSSSGHVAAIINPPGNPKAKFRVADDNENRRRMAEVRDCRTGSWWPDFSAWAAKRGGGKVAAPTELGSETFKPIGPALGNTSAGLTPRLLGRSADRQHGMADAGQAIGSYPDRMARALKFRLCVKQTVRTDGGRSAIPASSTTSATARELPVVDEWHWRQARTASTFR